MPNTQEQQDAFEFGPDLVRYAGRLNARYGLRSPDDLVAVIFSPQPGVRIAEITELIEFMVSFGSEVMIGIALANLAWEDSKDPVFQSPLVNPDGTGWKPAGIRSRRETRTSVSVAPNCA